MKKRGGRCPACCCVVADDDSPWEACAETWTDADPLDGITTSDSDAQLLFLGELDSAAAPWRVSAYVAIAQPATATWQVKLLGGATACGGGAAELIWGHDADGEYFELHGSRTPADTSVLGPVGAGTRTYFLTLCWDGAELSASASLVGGFGATPPTALLGTLVAYAFTPTGTRAGVATGTLSGVTSVLCYGFTFEYLASATRTTCDVCSATHCCDGPIPATLLAEIGGLVGVVRQLGLYTECDIQCDGINGSLYLSQPGNGGDAHGYCDWQTLLFPAYAPCDLYYGFPVPDQLYAIRVRAFLAEESGTRYVYVTAVAEWLGNTILILSLRGAPPSTPCDQWTAWIDLSAYYAAWIGLAYTAVALCGFGGAPVARIKAIP